ncbi:AT1A3 [Hepatospora eriocheir]|uniref:AT1A3 n=1 Tax=Hepatospora eriocheir TaxID=1081669 RepID=A0A1X0QEE5_9MICR|nr:AT1A3 [Hepatospora eriocheir]
MHTHKKSIEELINIYDVKMRNGKVYKERKKIPGIKKNLSFHRENTHIIKRIFCLIKRPINLLLISASVALGVLYFFENEEKNHPAVLTITLIIVFLNICTELYYELKFFYKFKENVHVPTCKVLVGDKFETISTEDLVEGDVIKLCKSDVVGADGVIIQLEELKVDNSNISGSAEVIKKSLEPKSDDLLKAENVVLKGNIVISGTAIAIIFAVGRDTIEFINSKNEFIKKKKAGPITKEFDLFFQGLFIIATFISVILLAISFATGHELVYIFEVIIALYIGILPEGIPTTIDLIDYQAIRKLNDLGILITEKSTIENLSVLDHLILNKAGVITVKELFCEKIYDGTEIINVESVFFEDNEVEYKKLLNIGFICRRISDDYKNKIEMDHLNNDIILDAIKIFSYICQEISIKKSLNFNFNINQNVKFILSDDKYYTNCTHFYFNGKKKRINDKERKKLMIARKGLINYGTNVVCICQKTGDDLIFVCFLSFINLAKTCTRIVTDVIRATGINITMLTKDKSFYIKELSTQHLKIRNILRYENFDNLDDHIKRMFYENNFTLMGIDYKQKYKILKDLIGLNKITAVIANQTNEAPSLYLADVGVCTFEAPEACKESAAIIFKSYEDFIYCLEEGRLYLINLQKSVKYILMHITPQIIPLLLTVVLGIPLPISPILLVFADLFIEIFPSIFFAYEPPERDVITLQQKEYLVINEYDDSIFIVRTLKKFFKLIKSDVGLFSKSVLCWSLIEAGTLSTIGCLLGFFFALKRKNIPFDLFFFSSVDYFKPNGKDYITSSGELIDVEDQLEALYTGQSTYFLGYIINQFANMICCRRKYDFFFDKFFNNYLILISSLVGLSLTILINYLSFLETIFIIRRPSLVALIFPLTSAVLILLLDTFKKINF